MMNKRPFGAKRGGVLGTWSDGVSEDTVDVRELSLGLRDALAGAWRASRNAGHWSSNQGTDMPSCENL